MDEKIYQALLNKVEDTHITYRSSNRVEGSYKDLHIAVSTTNGEAFLTVQGDYLEVDPTDLFLELQNKYYKDNKQFKENILKQLTE